MPKLLRGVLTGICLLLWAVAADPVHGHAVLLSASPVDGSLVEQAPAEARLRFNETVEPLVIRVIGPDGTDTDLTAATRGAEELVIPLAGLKEGTHVLSWRVVSADGHPIPGTLVFSVGKVTGASGEVRDTDPAVRGGIWLARFLMTSALAIGVGGALFGACFQISDRTFLLIRAALALGAVAAPAYLGLHGLDALGLGLPAILSPQPWVAGWTTSFGPSVAIAVLAVGLALASRRRPHLAWAAAGLLALSYAVSGHAAMAQPRLLMRIMVTLHVTALCFWIGALIPLMVSRPLLGILPGFSRFAPLAVGGLLISGSVLAMVQLGPHPAQWATPYGIILAAKLVLLLAIFVLAAMNRWKLTAPVLAGDAAAARAMRRLICAELALALVVLGLAAGWRFTPPPRALAEQAAPVSAYTHLHSDALMANVILTPGASGPVKAQIELVDGAMAPAQAISVTLTLAQPDRGIERMVRQAEVLDPEAGLWQVQGLILPFSGEWSLELEIRLSRFSLARLSGTIDVE